MVCGPPRLLLPEGLILLSLDDTYCSTGSSPTPTPGSVSGVSISRPRRGTVGVIPVEGRVSGPIPLEVSCGRYTVRRRVCDPYTTTGFDVDIPCFIPVTFLIISPLSVCAMRPPSLVPLFVSQTPRNRRYPYLPGRTANPQASPTVTRSLSDVPHSLHVSGLLADRPGPPVVLPSHEVPPSLHHSSRSRT